MELVGKVALVTGSTSGIGEGVAMKFAELGAHVAITGSRPLAEAETSIAKIKEKAHEKSKIEYFQADLGGDVFEACKGLVQEITEKLGDIDILVNNAGVQHVSRLEVFPVDKWQLLMNLHLNATFMLMQLVLPGMKKADWGRIINIGSVHSLVASVEKSAYCAAKHAMVGLTKSAALENAEGGIAINCICPGWVHTPLVQKQIDRIAAEDGIDGEAAKRKLLAAKEPSRNFTTPEDIADMCVLLCGKAGANMKGATIPMDGGWSAI